MRFVLAIVLAAHGVAHLVGFISSWRLAVLPELPYKTTILAGRLDVGNVGVRAIGVLWLLAAVTFLAAAMAIAVEIGWALRLTVLASVASLFLCVSIGSSDPGGTEAGACCGEPTMRDVALRAALYCALYYS